MKSFDVSEDLAGPRYSAIPTVTVPLRIVLRILGIWDSCSGHSPARFRLRILHANRAPAPAWCGAPGVILGHGAFGLPDILLFGVSAAMLVTSQTLHQFEHCYVLYCNCSARLGWTGACQMRRRSRLTGMGSRKPRTANPQT